MNTNAEQIKILLVDDREENLLTLDAVLSSPDYKIIKASSGDEALRYLLDHEPAVILMDVQMPNLNGFETASIIKKSERTREIPIIFVTAIDKEANFVHQGYDYGAVDYINKPFDAHIMKSKVAVFVDLYRKTQRILKAERQLRESETRERERKIAELELRSLKREQIEQKKFRDLVEGIDHGIVWSAAADNMAFSFVSSTAERLLGYSSSMWFSEPYFWNSHLHPEDKEKFQNAIKKVWRENKGVGIEHRFIKANGQIIWLHTGIRVSQKSDGSGYEIRGLSVDITKIKEAERILELNKKRSDILAQASLVLSQSFEYKKNIEILGKLTTATLADIFIVDMLEYDSNTKPIVVSYQDWVKPESINKLREKLTQKIPTKPELVLDVNKEMNLKSCLQVPLTIRGMNIGILTLASAKNHYDADDLFFADDLARRISNAIDNSILYENAQSAVRVRDDFLSVASHELKTPLTPMKLSIQSIMRILSAESSAFPKSDKLNRMLENSNRQIEKLSKLIDNLLDISRITAGKLGLNIEEFDFVKMIYEVLQRFQSQFASANCDVELHLPEELPVQMDSFRLEQVITNLLTNALKYAPGKPIKISLSSDEQNIIFTVQDHGIGIAKEDQRRIFMRFERAVSVNHFGGLGLGLYISHQIVDAHGGTILVESEVDHGSTFTVKLPRIVCSSSVDAKEQQHPELSIVH
jgi:PAS domain S-box-containing protein